MAYRFTDDWGLIFTIECFYCGCKFDEPKTDWTKKTGCIGHYEPIICPNCKKTEHRHNYKCDPLDPLKHRLGWPYDDPRIPYDC